VGTKGKGRSVIERSSGIALSISMEVPGIIYLWLILFIGQRVLARLQAKNQLTKWMKKALAKPDVASDKLNELIDADFSKLRKHDEE